MTSASVPAGGSSTQLIPPELARSTSSPPTSIAACSGSVRRTVVAAPSFLMSSRRVCGSPAGLAPHVLKVMADGTE
eukprot:5180048-Prymnesium_polylepis.1